VSVLLKTLVINNFHLDARCCGVADNGDIRLFQGRLDF
jgi:hypothetical protein